MYNNSYNNNICGMALMKCLIISFSDLERHVVAEDEKLYLKEKGITSDDIQGMCT